MENTALKVPIYMYPLLNPEREEQIAAEPDKYPFAGSIFSYEYFGPRAQWLLSAVLASLNLTRQDEIAILTTSDETYVSICVSIPSFNFSRISRIITDSTKVIIVIHEFGFIYPDIEREVHEWRQRGIIIIEDCAHVIGVNICGKTVGSFGDYALFSLMKVIPGTAGGLLRTNHRLKLPLMNQNQIEMTDQGVQAAQRYLLKYQFFNNRRIQIYELLKRKFPDVLFEPSQISVPYFTGIISSYKEEVQANNSWVEWGPTLRDDLLYIPTNPLADYKYYQQIVNEVKRYENCVTR